MYVLVPAAGYCGLSGAAADTALHGAQEKYAQGNRARYSAGGDDGYVQVWQVQAEEVHVLPDADPVC